MQHGDFAAFISACLDADVALPATDDQLCEQYRIACRIMDDPVIEARLDAASTAWWNSEPFAALDLHNLDALVLSWPDFPMQVAQQMTRAEKLALRKRLIR
jgi:hypothetical protein